VIPAAVVSEPTGEKPLSSRLAGWLVSMKVRITLASIVCLALGISSITALVVTRAKQDLLDSQRQRELADSVRTADILSHRLVHLQRALQAASNQMKALGVADDTAYSRFLEKGPVLRGLFGGLFIIALDGQMRWLVDETGLRFVNLDLSKRLYVQETLRELRPVISEPLRSRVSGDWIIILTMPVYDGEGKIKAVLCGNLKLASRDLLDDLTDKTDSDASALMLVADASGKILAPAAQVDSLKNVADEPRLRNAYREWVASGSSLEPAGLELNQANEMVTVAGVPGTNWLVWRARSEAELLQPLRDAERYSFIWACALVAGLSITLLSLLWWLLTPLTQLRRRASHAVDREMAAAEGWPACDGELGELAEVLKDGAIERRRLEMEKQHLLKMLSSALDSAPIGIAFVRDDRFELVSNGFCAVLARDKAALLGQSIDHIFAGGTPPKSQALPPGTIGGRTGEWLMLRAGKTQFWGQLKCNPLDPSDLAAGSIWTLSDITSQRDARQELEWAATHESLTGLANRTLFERRAARLVEEFPGSAPAAIVYLDLDRFKPVNDSEGHAAGDAVLVAVARLLSASIRSGDLAARIGGDEFALLLERCEPEAALGIANDVCAQIAALEVHWDARVLRVGASAGVAELTSMTCDVSDWTKAADQACYAAKAAGRGMARIWSEPDGPRPPDLLLHA
jgi:diguanylate cyclase (GGDEF)-like protein